MMTYDKTLTQNYDSEKEKSEIDSDICVLKIRQRLAAHSSRRNCIYNKVKLSVSIDSLLCYYLGPSDLSTSTRSSTRTTFQF